MNIFVLDTDPKAAAEMHCDKHVVKEDSDGELFFEEVTERIGKLVLASKIHPATKKEVEHAKRMHELGNCQHNIVKDEGGWLYDFRKCAICGKGLGTV